MSRQTLRKDIEHLLDCMSDRELIEAHLHLKSVVGGAHRYTVVEYDKGYGASHLVMCACGWKRALPNAQSAIAEHAKHVEEST